MSRLLTALFAVLFLCLIAGTCLAVTALEYPKFQAIDSTGAPLSGGKIYTYEVGSTTPKTTYSNYAGTTANANPVILDSRGEASIYLNGTYKIVIYDSSDNLITTVDNVMGSTRLSDTQISSGTTGYFAIYSGVTSIASAASVSGASIFNLFAQGEKITGDKFNTGVTISSTGQIMGGVTTWVASANSTLPTWMYMGGILSGSGVSVQLGGVTTYELGYLIIQGRGGISVWGEGAAANSANGMKFHSDYGSAVTGIWIPSGDYDSKIVIKWTRDASGVSVYGESFSKIGTWKTSLGTSF